MAFFKGAYALIAVMAITQNNRLVVCSANATTAWNNNTTSYAFAFTQTKITTNLAFSNATSLNMITDSFSTALSSIEIPSSIMTTSTTTSSDFLENQFVSESANYTSATVAALVAINQTQHQTRSSVLIDSSSMLWTETATPNLNYLTSTSIALYNISTALYSNSLTIYNTSEALYNTGILSSRKTAVTTNAAESSLRATDVLSSPVFATSTYTESLQTFPSITLLSGTVQTQLSTSELLAFLSSTESLKMKVTTYILPSTRSVVIQRTGSEIQSSITTSIGTSNSHSASIGTSSFVTAPVTTQSPFNRDQYLIFRLTSLLANRTFYEGLANHTTQNYTNLAAFVQNELNSVLNTSGSLKRVAIVNFTNYNNFVKVRADIYYDSTARFNASNLKSELSSKSSTFVDISIKESCTNVSCSYRGTCQDSSSDVICSCTLGFSGFRCLTTYPVDGNYSNWSNYQSCSKSCGGGVQKRTRVCADPAPMHGGKNCSQFGAESESRSCNEDSCDAIDWVIWIVVGAAAFVLLMVIILACCFRCKKKYYYQDYGLTKDGKSYNLTKAAYVNQAYKENLADFRSNDNVVPLEIMKEDPFKNGYTNPEFVSDDANHNASRTIYQQELKTFLSNTHNVRAKDNVEYLEPEQNFHSPKKALQGTGANVVYENTPERLL